MRFVLKDDTEIYRIGPPTEVYDYDTGKLIGRAAPRGRYPYRLQLSTRYYATQTSGYLYEGGKLTTLGTLGGKYINPVGINASGLIVGWSSLPNGDCHACLLDRGNPTDLGTLDGSASLATAINAADTVVGISFGEVTRPFIWNLNVGMQDLNDLVSDSDWFLETVNDINDAGQIVGAGWHTLHGPKNVKVTEYHAFLLTPEETEHDASTRAMLHRPWCESDVAVGLAVRGLRS